MNRNLKRFCLIGLISLVVLLNLGDSITSADPIVSQPTPNLASSFAKATADRTPKPKWNPATTKWDQITINDLILPKTKYPFLIGTASCEYQNSGKKHRGIYKPNHNWTRFEERKDTTGKSPIFENHSSDSSAEHWERPDEYAAMMKDLGANSYRFSLDWSLIEPQEGQFNEEALAHYDKLLNTLAQNNIKPMVTLLHFTYPAWFEDKGAFEKEENLTLFTRFCKKVFERYSDKVELWCTINEPTVLTLMGYFLGRHAPGKSDPYLGGTVLKHLMKAHCDVYQTLKRLPNGKKAQIGIVHQLLRMVPQYWWNPIEQGICRYFTHVNHSSVFNFFKTGQFNFYTYKGVVSYVNGLAPYLNDFIGINYYSHPILGFKWDKSEPFGAVCYPGQIMTDMPYHSYPQGLYEAIAEASELKLPIYITENGIADAKDDRREKFITHYLYALCQAVKDGYDVRGYFYWTLVDNFEWDTGRSMKFGLYETDFKNVKFNLRKGSHPFRDFARKITAPIIGN